MKRKIGIILAAFAALALAACGGGGTPTLGSGTSASSSSSSSSGGTTSTAASIKMGASSTSVPSDGTAGATISALVLNSNNVAVSGATVIFGVSTGGELQNVTATTSANGFATAVLYAVGASAGTSLTVTAAVGAVSANVAVGVVKDSQTLTLLESSPQIPSDNSKPVTITAILRNASNQLVSGATVNFTSTSGGITAVQTTAGVAASVAAGTTDANGAAAATLTTAGDPTNRTITVTAQVGATTGTVTVAVVGTTLTITGPGSLIQGDAGTYTVALADSGSNGISGAGVTLASANKNPLSAGTVTTNSLGSATFQMTAANAGTDTLTATALGLTATQSVAVSSESFSFTAPAANTSIPISTPTTVTLVWTNAGVPQANQQVMFSATRGLFTGNVVSTTAITDATGTATVSISSTTAGPAVITATATGVTAQLALAFVATTPTTIDLQASPATVQTQGQSTISAIVRDVNNNLVANQTVDFQLTDTTGGELSVASAVTNSQGVAQTVYTASSSSSASNGVVIKATLPNSTSVPAATVDLTVAGQTLFLSLGTGNTISADSTNTLFILPYSVQALDSAGNAVANVSITFAVESLPLPTPASACTYTGTAPTTTTNCAAYAKGTYVAGASAWVWTPSAYCLNEDVNNNGILASGTNPNTGAPYDFNGNGVLDPGSIAAVSPGTVTTSSAGTASVNVTYPQNYANWVQVKLTATATVAGTQNSTSAVFFLPTLATDLTNITVTPPGFVSPWGSSTSCANTK